MVANCSIITRSPKDSWSTQACPGRCFVLLQAGNKVPLIYSGMPNSILLVSTITGSLVALMYMFRWIQGETINTRSKEQALKDPRSGNPSTQSLQGYDNYTGYQCQCYEPNCYTAMSCTWLPCTAKVLFIADNTLSLTDLIRGVVSLLSVLQSQACTHKAREFWDYLHLTFDPWACSLPWKKLGFAEWS